MSAPRFRQGLTIGARRQVRAAIVEDEIKRAMRRAAEMYLTEKCRRAMVITGERPEESRELHASCQAELPGRVGCLCQCHDVVTGSVITGRVELSPPV